jgi:hypothetical protein
MNGGQNVHVEKNTLTDCQFQSEQDEPILQVMTGLMYDHNTITTAVGVLDPLDNSIRGSLLTCNGKVITGSSGDGCWAVQNNLSGASTYTGAISPGTQLDTSCINLLIPGHYYGNTLSSGAVTNGCGTNQLNVPWP